MDSSGSALTSTERVDVDADEDVDDAIAVVLVLIIVEVGEPWRLDLEGDLTGLSGPRMVAGIFFHELRFRL